MKDKEFLQYIKETGQEFLLDIFDFSEEDIIKVKNTYHFQCWRLEKAKIELIREFAKMFVPYKKALLKFKKTISEIDWGKIK
jgi:hypothetical protein